MPCLLVKQPKVLAETPQRESRVGVSAREELGSLGRFCVSDSGWARSQVYVLHRYGTRAGLAQQLVGERITDEVRSRVQMQFVQNSRAVSANGFTLSESMPSNFLNRFASPSMSST